MVESRIGLTPLPVMDRSLLLLVNPFLRKLKCEVVGLLLRPRTAGGPEERLGDAPRTVRGVGDDDGSGGIQLSRSLTEFSRIVRPL